MPQYYNPYSFYPAYPQAYAGGWSGNGSYTAMPQQPAQSGIDTELVMKWVEGEGAAKAFNRPQGWPENRPIPLWDSTDTVIWLKSWGPMGIPNPMQKLRYEMPEQQSHYLPAGQSGASLAADGSAIMTSNYATKEDLDNMKNEIREMLRPVQQQNSHSNQPAQNNQNGSRGGNR